MATRAELHGRYFVFRPRPAHDEHVLSYLLRLGEMNGYTGRDTLGRFTRSITRHLQKKGQIEVIAQLAGLGEHDLLELLHRHRRIPNVHARLSGFVINSFFREPYTAYCPACIRERGIFRAIWNFRAVAICELHGQWLLESCPRCTALVGWDRPASISCACGFNLGLAETTSAPVEAALINQLLTSAVLGVGESDLLAEQHFCAHARRMSGLDWLAVANFLATFVGRSPRFHPIGRAGLDAEKRATLLAAKWFAEWPANAMQGLNGIAQRSTDGWKPPLISIQQFNARAPACYTRYRHGALALPDFMTVLIRSYSELLTVHRDGLGLAVNPDRLSPGADGGLGVYLPRAAAGNVSGSASDLEFLPLSRLVEGIRGSNIALYSKHEVERLIGATSRQLAALVRDGLLRSDRHKQRNRCKQLMLSTEVDRFRQWLTDMSSVGEIRADMVPLSRLSASGRAMLLRVLRAAMAGHVSLFRERQDHVSLDTCFIKMTSVVALTRWQRG